jgi:hypothetical protein
MSVKTGQVHLESEDPTVNNLRQEGPANDT